MIRPLLDGDDLERYRTDGYVALGPILDHDRCAELLEVERRHRPAAAGSEAAEPGLLVREQLCAQSAALRDFCIDGPHVPLLAQVLGPDVAFTHTQFITKFPDPRPDDDAASPTWIPMHQDDGYGQLDPPLDVTVWTALTDTDERNGCLVIVPGSHHGGLVDHAPSAANPFLREAEAGDAVPLPLRAGEAVLFTGLTLHGSGPNRSSAPRVGMHARYCHPAVRMVTHRDKPVLADRHSWMVLGEAGPTDARAVR